MTDESALNDAPSPAPLPRLLFLPGRTGSLHARVGSVRHAGAVLPADRSIAALKATARLLGNNTGNLIHEEAPAKIFAHDDEASCLGLWPLIAFEDGAVIRRACRAIERDFDAVIYSFANIIRTYDHVLPARLAEIELEYRSAAAYLRYLRIPVHILGVGMQDELPVDRSGLWPPLLDLLVAANRRAGLFTVRGEATRRWLERMGFRTAKALGCPSLFAYPDNLLGIEPPGEVRLVTAGGHLHRAPRGQAGFPFLQRLAAETDCDYVFQNDLISLAGKEDDAHAYDDATFRVSHSFVERRLRGYGRWVGPSFRHYHYFRSTGAWRAYAAGRDLFVGDRFHGGVAFLQAGRPAIFVQGDIRVEELTAFFDLPTVRLAEAGSTPVRDLVDRLLSVEALERMKTTYRRRLADFRLASEAVGLRFAREAGTGRPLAEAPAASLSGSAPPLPAGP